MVKYSADEMGMGREGGITFGEAFTSDVLDEVAYGVEGMWGLSQEGVTCAKAVRWLGGEVGPMS